MTAETIWGKTCEHLKQVLSRDVYDRWIALIEAGKLGEDRLELTVANDFYQTWLEEHYLPLIADAVAAVCGKKLDVRFTVDQNAALPIPPAAPDKPKRVKRDTKKSNNNKLNRKYTFDNFVVGPSNHFAHAASLAVAQSPAKAYNPFFIYGGVGLGKTHLMQAIGSVIASTPGQKVAYLTCEEFVNDYIDALQRKALVQFRRKYRGTDILLIDDIQFLAGKERMQEEFFHTFNALFENRRQIVLASDRPASEINGLEHRLISRFEWGLVTELEVPDVETRIAILRKKRDELRIDISDAIISYIAEHIRSNIRRLEGALIRVTSYNSLTGRPLEISQMENLLRDCLDKEQQQAVTMEQIQRTVADFYDIRLGDMTSNRRPKEVAFPRQIAMYLCRNYTEQSLPAIGRAFGRNHATVLYACRKVSAELDQNGDLRRNINQLSHQLGR